MLWVSAGTNKWKREMALATQSRRECPLRARVCALKIVRLREWHGHGWKWDATSKCVTSDASTLTLFACSLSLYISWTYFFIYFFCDFETMLRWWWYGLCRADDITEANKQNTKRNCGIKDEKMEQRTNAQWQSFANAGRHILFLAILLFISPHSNPSNNKEWRKKVDRKKIAAAVVACSAKSLMDRCMDGSHQKFCSRDVFPLVVFVGFCLCRDDAIAAAVARCNRATVDASPMPPSSSTISFSRFQHSNILFVYTIVYLYHKHIIYNRATHRIAYFLLWVPFYMGYFMESRYSSITKVAHSSH